MLSLPVPGHPYSMKTKCEGYVLRYQTDDRNLSFVFKSPPNIYGGDILNHVARSSNLEPKSLRAFYIKSAKVAGEFENINNESCEKLMDNSCH